LVTCLLSTKHGFGDTMQSLSEDNLSNAYYKADNKNLVNRSIQSTFESRRTNEKEIDFQGNQLYYYRIYQNNHRNKQIGFTGLSTISAEFEPMFSK
jgi:hypothetical protein